MFVRNFFFPVWPWELHTLGRYSEIGWDLKLHEYMSEMYCEYTHGQAMERCKRLCFQMAIRIFFQRDTAV